MGKAGILHCRLDRCEPAVADVAPSRPSYNQCLMKPVQSRPGINAIVFDVGWVLVHLDYSPLTTYLKDHGADISSMRDVTSRIGLEQHETGALAGEELLENLARLGSRPMSQPELRQRWLNMFEPQEPMLALARALANRYCVHLLSNVGELHWDHMVREYGLDRIGHGTLTSYAAGVMKPHTRIYAEAERRFGLEPSSTVFIDDLPDNVTAARSRGWHGIEHRNHDATVEGLAALGVSIEE
jgi:FMN phosphatase YigB (HAD superfamily)